MSQKMVSMVLALLVGLSPLVWPQEGMAEKGPPDVTPSGTEPATPADPGAPV